MAVLAGTTRYGSESQKAEERKVSRRFQVNESFCTIIFKLACSFYMDFVYRHCSVAPQNSQQRVQQVAAGAVTAANQAATAAAAGMLATALRKRSMRSGSGT